MSKPNFKSVRGKQHKPRPKLSTSTKEALRRLAALNRKRGLLTIGNIMRNGTPEERQLVQEQLSHLGSEIKERLRLYRKSVRDECTALGLPIGQSGDEWIDLMHLAEELGVAKPEDETVESFLPNLRLKCEWERYRARLIAEALTKAKPNKSGATRAEWTARVEKLRAMGTAEKEIIAIMNREHPRPGGWTRGKYRHLTDPLNK